MMRDRAKENLISAVQILSSIIEASALALYVITSVPANSMLSSCSQSIKYQRKKE